MSFVFSAAIRRTQQNDYCVELEASVCFNDLLVIWLGKTQGWKLLPSLGPSTWRTFGTVSSVIVEVQNAQIVPLTGPQNKLLAVQPLVAPHVSRAASLREPRCACAGLSSAIASWMKDVRGFRRAPLGAPSAAALLRSARAARRGASGTALERPCCWSAKRTTFAGVSAVARAGAGVRRGEFARCSAV